MHRNTIELPGNFIKGGKKYELCENYSRHQDMVEFAVLKKSGIQVGDWMRCKDYIQDIIWGSKNKVSYSIYGWKFNYDKDKIDPNNLILALRRRAATKEMLSQYLKNCSSTIWDLESILGIPTPRRTKFSKIINDYFVVYTSKFWLRCIGTVSFLTWVLRSSIENNNGTWDSHVNNKNNYHNRSDTYYLNDGAKFIEYIKENGIESLHPDWDRARVGNVHNNGWVSYTARLKKSNPASTLYGASGNPESFDQSDELGDEDDDW